MSRAHGKNAHFSIDDSGGSLRDISADVDNTTGLPGARALSDVTSYTDGGERFIPGLEGAPFTVTGQFNSAATTGSVTVLNSLRTAANTASFVYGPEGNASGAIKYSGECWMDGLVTAAAVKDKVPFSASFRMDGTLTVGVF
jgi:hypothetical protein